MTEERIIIDGRSYISSVRAAQLFGYTKDYVGQLARAGKIKSQLIGRSWYVDEDSIRKHKLSVHYTLTKPKKPRKDNNGGTTIPRYANDEKSIENIDISDAVQRLIRPNPPEDIAKTRNLENRGLSRTETEEYDLFPRPIKQTGGDALVKSEFVYEPDPPPAYVRDVVSNSRPIKPQVDGISIRKATGAIGRSDATSQTIRENKRNTHSRGSTPSLTVPIDGIVVPKSHVAESNHYHKVVEDEVWDDSGISPEYSVRSADARNVYEEPFFEEDRPSRLISLLGGLILFLLLTILYLVLR